MKSVLKTVAKMAATIIIAICIMFLFGIVYKHAPEVIENVITGVICLLGIIWGFGSMIITVTGSKTD